MKFQPSIHKAQLLLLLLLLLDTGLFLASTSTIIDRISPKESLSASLAGGVHFDWWSFQAGKTDTSSTHQHNAPSADPRHV
jgi:hypothetical protein